MSSIKSTGISPDGFVPWLKREAVRSLRLSLALMITGVVCSLIAPRLPTALSSHWSSLNYQFSKVALDQHPLALARNFASRLRESEYGWKPLALTHPFNVTAARKRLRHDFPEVASVADGVPQVPRGIALKQADPARYDQRIAAYMARHRQIESGRFASLYDRDDPFSAPNANVQLGIFITKIFGLPDALIHVLATILAGGPAAVILFVTVLVVSAAPLWRSRRPARTSLKLLVWPALASSLVWGAIFFMGLAAAIFGGLTPDTSAVALLAALPWLSLQAKIPLHFAETLIVKRPGHWDGIDRRKSRPSPPNTVPPLGGA
jgi:hypothetical protein